MQLTIKKYDNINIYVLIQNNTILGMYNSKEEAELAKNILEYELIN
jgi:hypothetical protein